MRISVLAVNFGAQDYNLQPLVMGIASRRDLGSLVMSPYSCWPGQLAAAL